MVTLDEHAIRRIRLKARGLRHDPRLSKRKISRIIADEFGLPFNTVRYYAFIIGKDWKKDRIYKRTNNKSYSNMKFDELTIKKLRRRAGGLRHDFRLSERKIAKIIANEYNILPEIIRYHISIKDKRYPGHYDLKYKRLIRHVDSVLPQVFNGNPELSLNDICIGIDNLKGISLKEGTLEKLIGKYQRMPRGPPIVKTETGNYKLNPSFYNR